MQDKNFFRLIKSYDDFVDSVIPHYEEIQAKLVENLDFLPADAASVVDLGCGTGKTVAAILKAFPNVAVTGIDSAPSMLDEAQKRLDIFDASRWQLLTSDIINTVYPNNTHAFISVATINNIPREYLLPIYEKIYAALIPGGWFVHADFIRHEAPEVDTQLEAMYRSYVEAHNTDKDFVKKWFEESESGYFPATLSEHFSALTQAGFAVCELKWLCGNQALFRARK